MSDVCNATLDPGTVLLFEAHKAHDLMLLPIIISGNNIFLNLKNQTKSAPKIRKGMKCISLSQKRQKRTRMVVKENYTGEWRIRRCVQICSYNKKKSVNILPWRKHTNNRRRTMIVGWGVGVMCM
jgi:hypothetical protein